jgi:anti-sigma factor RsiW
MSDCHRIRDLMGPHLYGDLHGKELRSVEAHLAICPECRAEFAAVESAIALLPRSSPKPSGDTRARMMAALEQRAGELLTVRRSRPAAGWLPTVGLAAAALVLGVLVGYQLPRGTVRRPDRPAPEAVSSVAATRAIPAPSGDVGEGRQGSGETASASADVEAETGVTSDRHEESVTPQTGPPTRGSSAGGRPAQALVRTTPVLRPPRPLGIDDVQVAEAAELEVMR